MNQISELGMYTVLHLCWTALPALMAGNARLFFLALLQLNSVKHTLILIVFFKILEHILYILLSTAFLIVKKTLNA